MKKILTIGRDAQCDICINDSTDVVSRNHAILEIGKNGKYFIIDQSRNGTYVNGMRISQNEKVPVTRNDVISLAHVRELDWSLVPKSGNRMLLIGVISSVCILAVVAIVLLLSGRFSGKSDGSLNLSGNGTSVEQSDGGAIIGTPDDGTKTDDNPTDAVDTDTDDENTPAEKKDDESKTEKPKSPKKQKKADDKSKGSDAVVDAIY